MIYLSDHHAFWSSTRHLKEGKQSILDQRSLEEVLGKERRLTLFPCLFLPRNSCGLHRQEPQGRQT